MSPTKTIALILVGLAVGCGQDADPSIDPDGQGVADGAPGDSDGSFPPEFVAGSLSQVHGTFLGGTTWERVQGTYIDENGYIYVTGQTHSTDFPTTTGAFDETKDGNAGNGNDLEESDGFVAKLSPDGSKVLWATILGGSRRDAAYGVRTDSMGNVYVTGATGSGDFPTTEGAYDRTHNGSTHTNALSDVFVSCLSLDGSKLLFSTFIGGGGTEESPRGSIYIDESRGRIYIAGATDADDFPVTDNAYQGTLAGRTDAFVLALSIDGKSLLHSTYLGGQGNDIAVTNIAVRSDGTVYVAGGTTSDDFPTTPGAFQSALKSGAPSDPFSSGDGWVARFSGNLDSLLMSTYFGGSAGDSVSHNQGLNIDSQGRVIVVGITGSDDLPTTGGALSKSLSGGEDVFVAAFTETGVLSSATYLGGTDFDYPGGISFGSGLVYVSGSTTSNDFPVSENALQSSRAGGEDVFLTALDESFDLVYSTYIGGSGDEIARSNWARGDKIVVGGRTSSSDFPVKSPSPYPTFSGDSDGFLLGFQAIP